MEKEKDNNEKEDKTHEMSELLEQVKNEIRFWLDAIWTKRQIFRDRLHLYIEPNKEEWKISNNTLYAMVQLFQAINYEDQLSVIFMPRKFWDEEYAENLTDVAKFDQEEMQLNKLNFQVNWDRAMFWVGIKVKNGWDDVRKTPIYSVKDPLTWIPDPSWNHIDKFRFHYFEEQMMKSEMTEDKWFIKSAIDELYYRESDERTLTQNSKNEATWMNYADENRMKENTLFNIINWFTIYDWRQYLVTVDANCWVLLRAEMIEAVTKEEEEDTTLIEAPVLVSWFSPLRWDPFWVSLADLVEDKQKWQQILTNLQLINAKFSTLWQTLLYDPKAVKNRNDLISPTTDLKLIAYDSSSWTPISNAIYPVPRSNLLNDSFTVSDTLARQIQFDTWIDARSLWIQWDKNITLWESQQIQANANIRLWLNIEVNNWSERAFWKNWLRCYQEYFSRADKKFIRITWWFWNRSLEFRKDDFMAIADPDIVIESKKNIEQLRKQQQIAFAAKLPLILQDPNIPQISKLFAMRYSLRLDWMNREYISIIIPDTVDELNAKQKLPLLDMDDMDWAEIESLDEDHFTYLMIFERARDTKAKKEAIERRKQAIILTWQNKQWLTQWWAVWWAANASASQMTSALIWQGKQTESLQNITNP